MFDKKKILSILLYPHSQIIIKESCLDEKKQPEDKWAAFFEQIYTCFTSDFFHPAADEWRTDTDSTGAQCPLISSVSVGGESGPNARLCDFGWVLSLYLQCVEYGISFTFHQTGAKLRKGGREYRIGF